MEIFWTSSAINSLKSELRLLDEINPEVAKKIKIRIQEKTELLLENPFMGVRYGIREIRKLSIVQYPFSIFYNVKNQKIEILRIRHDARKPIENIH